jgi:hypothetical protein
VIRNRKIARDSEADAAAARGARKTVVRVETV